MRLMVWKLQRLHPVILRWIISEIWVLSEMLDCFTPASRARILLLFICIGGAPMVLCGDFQKCSMLWVQSCWDNGGFNALNPLSVRAIKVMGDRSSCTANYSLFTLPIKSLQIKPAVLLFAFERWKVSQEKWEKQAAEEQGTVEPMQNH